MALASSLALSGDSATDVDTNLVTFVQRFSDDGKSVYSVAGLTPNTEFKFSVSHTTDKDGTQRHLVRVDRNFVNALNLPVTLSNYLVMVRPPDSVVTNAYMISALNCLIDFLIEGGSNANVTAVLNGEN